jgi:carbon monoxide dehydrogenase subunit G
MSTLEVSTFINRPPQEVFDFMTNPANSSKWQNGTESARWVSEGPVGVGSISHTVGKLLGRKFESDAEVSQWNPPTVWGVKSSNGPLKFEGTNKFEPKDGGTLVIQTAQVEAGGFFKLAEGLAIKQLQKQVASDGQTLKKLLEAR